MYKKFVQRRKAKYIILASKSPWRKRLLKKHGIECRIYVTDFKELKKHKNPRRLVLYNAVGKARLAAKHYKNAIIIGVDTVGVLDGKIIGKPKNRAHAKRMLKSLSGRMHYVITGLCLIDSATGKKITAVVKTKVKFRKLGEAELEKYLDCGQWKGKAGAYAIQARAKGFVEKIEGDVTNVVGIPVKKVKKMLNKMQKHKIRNFAF